MVAERHQSFRCLLGWVRGRPVRRRPRSDLARPPPLVDGTPYSRTKHHEFRQMRHPLAGIPVLMTDPAICEHDASPDASLAAVRAHEGPLLVNFAAQAFQHDANLLFSGMMPACGSANISDCLFSALRYVLARLSHRCISTGLR